MMKSLTVLAFLVSLQAVAVTIDGTWQIVVPPPDKTGVQRALKEMAGELKWALCEGSGLELPIAIGGEIGPKRIFVGRDFAVAAGFDLSDYKAMDNAYAEKNGAIYCFGNDRSGCLGKHFDWTRMYLPSAKAVTRFMSDALDVRFLMPGRIGTDVPKVERAALADGAFSKEVPPFDYCDGTEHGMLYSLANGTMSRGTYRSFGGHLWPKAVSSELFREHPEYFALVGNRRVYGTGGHEGSLCISNPAVEELLVAKMLECYDNGADVVQLAQMDGWNFCECEKCGMEGGIKNAERIGEKIWAYHLRIAERIGRLRPGKKVWIISYSATFDPPKNIKRFPDNVIVEVAHVSEAQFARWRDIDVPGGFTAYVYLWGNYPWMGFTAKRSYHYCVEFVKMLLRNRVHGLFRCGYGELMGMEGPANWVFNHAISNPDLDVNACVEEYCRRAYGPASAEMRQFHDALDKRLRGVNAWEALNDTGAWAPKAGDFADAKPANALDWIAFVYTPEVISRMDGFLCAAERKTDDAKIRKRLELVRKEFDYAANLGRIAHLYYAYRILPSKTTLLPLLDEIDARNAFIDSLYDDEGSMKPFPGWPEIKFFGTPWSHRSSPTVRKTKAVVKTNGRLRATIGAPLSWQTGPLRKSETLPGASRKTMTVHSTAVEPGADDFEAGEWKSAKWQDLGGIQGEKVNTAARFKMLAGAKELYLAVESDLPDGQQTIEFSERDGKCWADECYDLTIAPNGTCAVRYHLIWNPGESKPYDAAVGLITDPFDPLFGKEDAVWNGDWRIRNTRRDGKWRSCVAIPYSSLGAKGGVGSKWYFNIGRAANVRGPSAKRELLLWNPDLETAQMSSPDAMGFFRVTE